MRDLCDKPVRGGSVTAKPSMSTDSALRDSALRLGTLDVLSSVRAGSLCVFMPIAASGLTGAPWQEALITLGVVIIGAALLAASILVAWGCGTPETE
jgi:hypothetical protein